MRGEDAMQVDRTLHSDQVEEIKASSRTAWRELTELDKLGAGEERETKSCSSVSDLNGWVSGGVHC